MVANGATQAMQQVSVRIPVQNPFLDIAARVYCFANAVTLAMQQISVLEQTLIFKEEPVS